MFLIKSAKLAADAWEQTLVEVFVLIETGLEIVDAELVFATRAGHMITTFVFVDSDSALGTLNSAIILLPFFKVHIRLSLSALTIRVRNFTTCKAHSHVTGLTNDLV